MKSRRSLQLCLYPALLETAPNQKAPLTHPLAFPSRYRTRWEQGKFSISEQRAWPDISRQEFHSLDLRLGFLLHPSFQNSNKPQSFEAEALLWTPGRQWCLDTFEAQLGMGLFLGGDDPAPSLWQFFTASDTSDCPEVAETTTCCSPSALPGEPQIWENPLRSLRRSIPRVLAWQLCL